MNHDILLDKLCYYGIHGSALLWFRSYWEKRRQRVEILHHEFGKTSSGWETITVHSPLLFLLYINDLPLGINIDSKLLLYPEDTSILILSPDIQEALSKSLIELDSIHKWCTTNGLSLN